MTTGGKIALLMKHMKQQSSKKRLTFKPPILTEIVYKTDASTTIRC